VILGGTIFDLLDRHAGPLACEVLVARLRREGPAGNLTLAFEAPLGRIERAWREQLDEIVYRQSERFDAPSLSEALHRTSARTKRVAPDGAPSHQSEELDLPTPPELDLGTPPEFFDNGDLPRRLVEEEDQGSGEEDRREEPRR
jgi:hypothetical protein